MTRVRNLTLLACVFAASVSSAQAQPAADIQVVGAPCSGSSLFPFSPPTLGNHGFALGILAPPPLTLGAIVFAVDAAPQGVAIPGSPCLLYVDPSTVFAVVETAPNGVLGLPIPASPTSLGLTVAVQGVFLDASSALSTTNGFEITVGT